ncbi:MAG: class I SAM-dependent methyltransferase [Planctomycetales bacterium]|nr:class I SAM-dependent methyltransferase [Planctomycetales bacterium]
MISPVHLAEYRWLPDAVIRMGMRRLMRERLAAERQSSLAARQERYRQFVDRLRQSEITLHARQANEQHYEVPPEFFTKVLGTHLKYSCGLWQRDSDTLDDAEVRMLHTTCERAGIRDGMSVLDLGCGWGSLSLWIAHRFPNCLVHAMSNSRTQKAYIEAQCRQRGLENLSVETADIATFQTSQRYDRVMSVEMFEHVRNYGELLAKIATWLHLDGQLFVHIFCHRHLAYAFEVEGPKNWMGRHFFTGGIMPSERLLAEFDHDLRIHQQWWINGVHYAKTCEAWLKNLDAGGTEIDRVLASSGNPSPVAIQRQRWRMFLMACAELFATGKGEEWGVSHYTLRPRRQSAACNAIHTSSR